MSHEPVQGDDALIGSAGNDRLIGYDGADVLVGNEGKLDGRRTRP